MKEEYSNFDEHTRQIMKELQEEQRREDYLERRKKEIEDKALIAWLVLIPTIVGLILTFIVDLEEKWYIVTICTIIIFFCMRAIYRKLNMTE